MLKPFNMNLLHLIYHCSGHGAVIETVFSVAVQPLFYYIWMKTCQRCRKNRAKEMFNKFMDIHYATPQLLGHQAHGKYQYSKL